MVTTLYLKQYTSKSKFPSSLKFWYLFIWVFRLICRLTGMVLESKGINIPTQPFFCVYITLICNPAADLKTIWRDGYAA